MAAELTAVNGAGRGAAVSLADLEKKYDRTNAVDGVSLDIDKALASYTKIKKDVVKWWDTGAVPTQLLTDREVAMTTVWNGRMAAIQAAGVPAAVSWSQGLLKRDAWGIPKGAKNKTNAMKFVAFSTMAIPQARIALGIPYGSVNNGSTEFIPEERLKVLPSARMDTANPSACNSARPSMLRAV